MRFALRRVGPSSCSPLNVNHLARDHLEIASLAARLVAHIAAVKPDHDRADWLCRVGGILLLTDGLADLPRPVAHRAGVLVLLIGSSSDSRAATLPNGANAA